MILHFKVMSSPFIGFIENQWKYPDVGFISTFLGYIIVKTTTYLEVGTVGVHNANWWGAVWASTTFWKRMRHPAKHPILSMQTASFGGVYDLMHWRPKESLKLHLLTTNVIFQNGEGLGLLEIKESASIFFMMGSSQSFLKNTWNMHMFLLNRKWNMDSF